MSCIHFYQSPVGILEITEKNAYITGVRLLASQDAVPENKADSDLPILFTEACKQLEGIKIS